MPSPMIVVPSMSREHGLNDFSPVSTSASASGSPSDARRRPARSTASSADAHACWVSVHTTAWSRPRRVAASCRGFIPTGATVAMVRAPSTYRTRCSLPASPGTARAAAPSRSVRVCGGAVRPAGGPARRLGCRGGFAWAGQVVETPTR